MGLRVEMKNGKRRMDELDVMKCIGIIMVLIGHTSGHPVLLHSLIYSVHMPLFFFLSGCTNRSDEYYVLRENVVGFIRKRIQTLYVPFLYYVIPIVLFHNVFSAIGFYDHSYDLKGYVVQLVRSLLMSVGENEPFLPQMWFMKVLFIMEIGYAGLTHLSHKLHVSKLWFVLVLPLVSMLIDSDSVPHVFRMNLLYPMRAMLFYYCGGVIIRYLLQMKYAKLQYSAMVVGLLLWCLVSFLYTDISLFSVCGFTALMQIVVSMTFVFFVWWLSKNILRVKWLSAMALYIGRHTMPIYALHYLAFSILSVFVEVPWYIYVMWGLFFSMIIYQVVFKSFNIVCARLSDSK